MLNSELQFSDDQSALVFNELRPTPSTQVSHPFACRKPSCPKCCIKFPPSTKQQQQDAVGSKPAAASSPSMTPHNPRGDLAVISGSTFYASSPAHPVVTQGIQGYTSRSHLICFIVSIRFPLVSCLLTVSGLLLSKSRRHPLV